MRDSPIIHVTPFHGGLKLAGHKKRSTETPIRDLPLPKRLSIPLQQHAGNVGSIICKIGQALARGEPLTKPPVGIGSVVHASGSGIVERIGKAPVVNRSGIAQDVIVIRTDDQQIEADPLPPLDPAESSDAAIIERLLACGVVGLGGATFPTHNKVDSAGKTDTLVVNGVECEPWISCDDRLMREHAPQIVAGIRLLMQALGADDCRIGIEDNKPEAIAAMQAAVQQHRDERLRVAVVPTIYPSGGEKQLIQLLTGQEVPSGGLPAELGIICVNVGTCYAAREALAEGTPLTERVVTVAGDGVGSPGNFRVRIGTPIIELLRAAEWKPPPGARVLMGGPMMGIPVSDLTSPVVKASNCILVQEATETPPEKVCIRCGDCVSVCPARLLPQQLYWYTRAREFPRVEELGVFDCIECGCCDYVCPSHIPLVDYYRHAKFELRRMAHEKQRSDRARDRFQAREERLARNAEEKAAKRTAKLKKLKQKSDKENTRDEIQAAVERAAAKKQARAKDNNDQSA